MRIALVLVAVVACDERAEPPPSPPPPTVAPPAPPAPPVVPRPPPQPGAVEAPPGGAIDLVATTPGEDAALTFDATDEARLWPALDGSRPPLVVALPRPRALALQHAPGGGFVAALVLPTGALEVAYDARGLRTAVHELPACDGIAALGDGFVAWTGHALRTVDVLGAVSAPVDAPQPVTAVSPAGAARVGGHWRALTRAGDTLALGGPVAAPPPAGVVAHGSDLALASATGPRYLGYAYLASDPPDGDLGHLTVASGDGRWLVLDPATFAPVRELAPPVPGAAGLRWVAGDDWLVTAPDGVHVWTEAAPTATLALAKASVVDVEPTSRLVLLADRALERYAPDRHALERVAFTDWGDAGTEAHLLTPALAHGAVLALSRLWSDAAGYHGSLRYIRDVDHPERGDARWASDGRWPVGVTRGGVSPINEQGKYAVVVDADGREHPVPGEVALSPSGRQYLQRGDDARWSLVTDHVAWTMSAHLSGAPWEYAPSWLDDTHLVLLGVHGLATIDLATGALANARAGWGFELARQPHAESRLGHPLVADVAQVREAAPAMSGDAAFQKLVRGVVAAIGGAHLTGWGPMPLDGAVTRVAWLQAHEDTGTPQLAVVVETAPGTAVVVLASAWGFPILQGPWPDGGPAWGTLGAGNASGLAALPHTMDETALVFASQWIHMSNESVAVTREHGQFVVTSDAWVERDNTGHGIDTTTGGGPFAPGARPRAGGYKGHAMRLAVSAPSADPAELAAAIHDIPVEP